MPLRPAEKIALITATTIACGMAVTIGWIFAPNLFHTAATPATTTTSSLSPIFASAVPTDTPTITPTETPTATTLPTPHPTPVLPKTPAAPPNRVVPVVVNPVVTVAPTHVITLAAPTVPAVAAPTVVVAPTVTAVTASTPPPSPVLAVPGRVTVSAQAGSSTATISWQPGSTGGSPITGYLVSRDGSDSTGGGTYSTIVSATTLSYTMTLLKPGTPYTLSVAAINAVGTGPANAATVQTTAAITAPGAPAVNGSAGAGSATVTWSAPSNGGSAITGYRVSRDGTDTTGFGAYTTVVSPSTFSFTMTLLHPGTPYTLSVAAINSVGTGPATSVTVTTS